MMSLQFPYALHFGSFTILLHGVFEFFGIFIAFRYYLFLKRKQGDNIASSNRLYIIIAAAMGAVLGARIVGSLENFPEWMQVANKWAYFYGNKTLVGGLLGALFSVELAKKLLHEKQNSGDLFTFPLMLGMIIGRIGCFSAGIYEETYGVPTSLPWAMNLGDNIPRHPVTIYEIIFLMLLWIILLFLRKNYTLQRGAIFKIFMIAYLIFRCSLDFIKPGYRYFFGLGTIQIVCLTGLIYYVRYLVNPGLLFFKKSTYAR